MATSSPAAPSPAPRAPGLRFSIDRGGTFTDVYAEVPARLGGGFRVLKLLSEDTANYRDAPTEGIRRVLEEVTGVCARFNGGMCVCVRVRMRMQTCG